MTRGRYEGVANIVRFNWPFFAVAGPLTLAAALGALLVTTPVSRIVLSLIAACAGGGMILSLGVSHLIYDRSELYRFSWLSRAVDGGVIRAAVFCQTGFDESSTLLTARTPQTAWTLLDHYDPVRMTEPSIQRARRRCPPAQGTLPAPFDAWPTPDASADVVLGMLAVHELRSEQERTRWFAEARRTLRTGGRVIVVEHVRDLVNALAFGPGALHFHTTTSWRRSWAVAALRQRGAFRITPWIRVFVLECA
jgi:SAM-dependent methyltransferase